MNTQDLILNYIFSYLKNTKNVRINNELTVGSRLQDSIIGDNSFTAGINNAARSEHSIAMGSNTEAGSNSAPENGNGAVALGEGTKAYSKYQLVHGKFNESDSNNIYAHIVGGGDSHVPKNIYTLDWEGRAWFKKGISIGDNNEEVATTKYIDQILAIKFYPHTEVNDSLVKICVNDLDPYTIYKLDTNKEYRNVQFYVKSEFGEILFLHADSNLNKYNMFVSNKTDNEMSFIIDSILYKINLKTGRVEKLKNKAFLEPDDEESIEYARIDDDVINPNLTWSSLKISQGIEGNFNEAKIENNHLILSRDGMVMADLPLPVYTGPEITEDSIMKWNSKLDNPGSGSIGQFLGVGNTGLAWMDLPETEVPEYATQIKYENEFENVETVQQALDKLLYKKPEILSLTSSVPFGLREIGDKVIAPITFNWEYKIHKPIVLQSLSDININPTEKSFKYAIDDISKDTNFTLKITDTENGSATLTKSYTFGYGEYYGASLIPEQYDENFIRKFNKKILVNKNNSVTVKANPNQYIYICIPNIWGTPIFSSGGFDGGFEKVTELSFTNDYGHIELYSIWKSDNHSLGNTTINIR